MSLDFVELGKVGFTRAVHRLGLVPERDIASVLARCGTAVCLAERGHVWLYSTPVLHASDSVLIPCHRRVLQIDFAATDLPNGLEWVAID